MLFLYRKRFQTVEHTILLFIVFRYIYNKILNDIFGLLQFETSQYFSNSYQDPNVYLTRHAHLALWYSYIHFNQQSYSTADEFPLNFCRFHMVAQMCLECLCVLIQIKFCVSYVNHFLIEQY